MRTVERAEAVPFAGPDPVGRPEPLSSAILQPSTNHEGPKARIKRAADVVLSLAGLAVLSPLFVLAAAAVKWDSPGPVLYQSPRWGRYGRRIYVWKFRTMIDGADDLLQRDQELKDAFHENIKLVDDPRVTRVGKVLRRWSVDELPQLWNVVVGDMSLVGPRPKLIGEEGKYGNSFEAVLSVPQGITGLWQVSGRNHTSYDERVALDLEYAKKPSLWLDLQILLRTVLVVLRGTGAH